jgi:hypothetical protein
LEASEVAENDDLKGRSSQWHRFAQRGRFEPCDRMSDLHQFDPTAATRFSFQSTWQRIFLFFACCWVGTLVAVSCYEIPDTFRSLGRGDVFSIIGEAFEHLIWAPLTWFGLLFAGFGRGVIGILMLPILGAALLIILLSEDEFWHGVFLLLATQPIHALWALHPNSFVPWLALVIYLGGNGWVYVLYRNSR